MEWLVQDTNMNVCGRWVAKSCAVPSRKQGAEARCLPAQCVQAAASYSFSKAALPYSFPTHLATSLCPMSETELTVLLLEVDTFLCVFNYAIF